MGHVGLSLVLASVVYLIVRPPPWLSARLKFLHSRFGGASAPGSSGTEKETGRHAEQNGGDSGKAECDPGDKVASSVAVPALAEPAMPAEDTDKKEMEDDRIAMPPPPFDPPIISPPQDGEQTTPKALAASPSVPVPSFNLGFPQQPASTLAPVASLMPPPARPSRPPTLSPTPSRGPGLSVPPRGPGTSTLAPPPTLAASPSGAKPRRSVVTLQPGRSPLDWARISSGPTADLRNLPPQTPYLKVTRSRLAAMNGRRGADAWMALGGRVYNVSPYKDYHPGGVGELFRGAGKDGTTIFGEVHPWVNYETMLQACLVGVLVEDEEERTAVGSGRAGAMEEMD